VTSVPILVLAFVLAGVGIGCVETAEHTAVAFAAQATIQGSAFRLLAAVQCFGNLAASGIAGLIWTLASPEAAFVYIAAWMLVALASLASARSRFETSLGRQVGPHWVRDWRGRRGIDRHRRDAKLQVRRHIDRVPPGSQGAPKRS
jgi:MFS family permease